MDLEGGRVATFSFFSPLTKESQRQAESPYINAQLLRCTLYGEENHDINIF